MTLDQYGHLFGDRLDEVAERLAAAHAAAFAQCCPRGKSSTSTTRPGAAHPRSDQALQKVPPAGFEPAHPPPEGGALSPELRGLVVVGQGRSYQPRNLRRTAPLTAPGAVCLPGRRASAPSSSPRRSVPRRWCAPGRGRPRPGGARPRTPPCPFPPGDAGSSAAGTPRRTQAPTEREGWPAPPRWPTPA